MFVSCIKIWCRCRYCKEMYARREKTTPLFTCSSLTAERREKEETDKEKKEEEKKEEEEKEPHTVFFVTGMGSEKTQFFMEERTVEPFRKTFMSLSDGKMVRSL